MQVAEHSLQGQEHIRPPGQESTEAEEWKIRSDLARFRANAAGFTIHSAIHTAREDLSFVIHTRTAAGKTAAEAFHEIYFLERACQAQIQAMAGGTALRIPPAEVCALTANQFSRDESEEIMNMAWSAALWLIETPHPTHPPASALDYRS